MHPQPDRLAAVPLFAELSDEQRARIAAWLDEEAFEQGTRLTREGAADYEFFVIADGRVRVAHEGATVAELGPGDVFGELAIIGGGRRRADVTAVTDVTIWSMFGTRFRELQLEMPEVSARLEELARDRARALGDA